MTNTFFKKAYLPVFLYSLGLSPAPALNHIPFSSAFLNSLKSPKKALNSSFLFSLFTENPTVKVVVVQNKNL